MFVVREVLESISKSKNMSQNSNYFYKNTSFFQNNTSKVIIIRDNHDFKSCTKISIKKIWKINNIFRLPYLTFFLVFNNLFNSSSVQKNTKLSSYSLCSKKIISESEILFLYVCFFCKMQSMQRDKRGEEHPSIFLANKIEAVLKFN